MNIYEQLATFNIIETERLLLRPLSMSDASDMFTYASQADNLIYIFPKHKDLSETKLIISNMFMKEPLGKWAIEEKRNHKMIGTITFVKLNEQERGAEIGYVLNKAYWSQGLMTEAVNTLSDMSLTVFGLAYIDIVADVDNLGSTKVAEKSGFHVVETYKAINPYTKVHRIFKRYRKTRS